MNITEFNQSLNELGFNSETKRIEVGLSIYSLLKKEFGGFANKFKGVDFQLNNELNAEEIKLI